MLTTAASSAQYTDAETGFQYLRARYYDPSTGVFLTRDPIEPITRSAYGYVFGDPLNLVDPRGLAPEASPTPPSSIDALSKMNRGPDCEDNGGASHCPAIVHNLSKGLGYGWVVRGVRDYLGGDTGSAGRQAQGGATAIAGTSGSGAVLQAGGNASRGMTAGRVASRVGKVFSALGKATVGLGGSVVDGACVLSRKSVMELAPGSFGGSPMGPYS